MLPERSERLATFASRAPPKNTKRHAPTPRIGGNSRRLLGEAPPRGLHLQPAREQRQGARVEQKDPGSRRETFESYLRAFEPAWPSSFQPISASEVRVNLGV